MEAKSFYKTLFWLITGIFYGLLPIGIIFLLQYFNPSIQYSIDDILKEGILIFFCVAISASVMVDYIFVSKKLPKWIEFTLYGFPWALVVIASITYSQLVINNLSVTNLLLDRFVHMQFFVLTLTLIYVLVVKTIIFISSKVNF
ncbi:hypothetical protein C9994_07255 [Marivirga lumbricoides]|uniref:Uncharacterized protein n=1 Tax=Marivirga lumbricoides TaxID=1046115 RepID=A0A2T4DRL0_9BACT|nr:hypothetical protein C9994_07255 [Marivirga lumbricoides]